MRTAIITSRRTGCMKIQSVFPYSTGLEGRLQGFFVEVEVESARNRHPKDQPGVAEKKRCYD